MHPIFFQIDNLTIRWYGVMAALGFMAATIIISANRKYAKMTSDQATMLVFTCVISGILGARIFYVWDNWSQQFSGNFMEIFRIDHGGLVFYGGFFLASITIIILCKINKLDIIRVMDVTAPALAAGHALGRIGCFLNGCCFGKPSSCLLAIHYPEGSAPYGRYGSLALHPVQLYESGANILLFIFLFFLVRKTRRGVTMATYILVYGVLRFADEFFRGDHTDLIANVLTQAQTIGLVLIPVGIILLVYFTKYANKTDKTVD